MNLTRQPRSGITVTQEADHHCTSTLYALNHFIVRMAIRARFLRFFKIYILMHYSRSAKYGCCTEKAMPSFTGQTWCRTEQEVPAGLHVP